MENYLRSRIQTRLDALGINAFDVARQASLNRYIVSDLLMGKKETIRRDAMIRVADALDCDPEFLIGAQETPRRAETAGQSSAPGTIPLVGVCETGAWRKDRPSVATLPISPDPRYPADRQVGFLVRGEASAIFGFGDGNVVVALVGGAAREGDFVVTRRKRRGGEQETGIAQVIPGGLAFGSFMPPIAQDEVDILGRVISAHRVF